MIKKIIIGILLVLLALMVGVYFSLPSFVDKEAIKTQFTTAFKAVTGWDAEISGDVVVESFPTPHVVINSVYVHNIPGGISSFLLSMKLVEIYPAYTSFLGKRMSIGRIKIDDVDLEIERAKNNQLNWQDSSVQTAPPASFSGLSDKGDGGSTTITITNGYVRYLDAATNSSSEYKDLDIVFLNGGSQSESTLKLGFTTHDRSFAVAGRIGNIAHALSVGEMPATLSITSEKSALIYEGNAGYRDGKISINGNVKFATDDVGQWISTFMGNGEKVPVSDTESKDALAQEKLLPLQMKSSITSHDGTIIFPDVSLDGTIIKGGMHVEVTPPYDVNIKALINTLDLESLFESRFYAHKEEESEQAKSDAAQKESDMVISPKSFFHMLNMSSDLTFADTIYNGQHIRDSHVQFDTTNGEMTISQATATLPGDSRIVFAGIGKEGFQGFTLEGQLDASGADFAEAIKVMKANGAAIPVQDFKRFRLKANAIISPHELRLSEIAARVENMGFVGGFIATFGERIKLNAAMRIGGLNLDHFIDIWGIQEWRTSLFDTTPDARYDTFLARWLRKLDYDSSMSISLEQTIFNGLPREKADFKLVTTQGKVALDDIKTDYNGTHLTGNLGLDVTKPLPKITMNIVADNLDTAVFFTDGKPVPPAVPVAGGPPPPRWSHKEFDFHWLDLLSVSYHLKFGQYRQGQLTAQDLDLTGGVDDRTFTIDSMTGTVLGARVASKVSIKGGKIPSITLAANINSLDPSQLLPFLPVLTGMTGKYNISLRLDTSGIDMFSWVSSLEGTVGLGGSQVNIQGFNLSGVIHAVGYVRTVADILNVVKRAFPGGDTIFSNIEGQWTVANGVFKTSNARLVNDQADGTLKSQVDLVNWQMQSVINLTLKALDAAHPPGMTITFNGDMDRPEIALDTRSLEQYVTNRTSQQMLQEYGTH